MFWSDWGRSPRIERAGMDGSHRSRIEYYLFGRDCDSYYLYDDDDDDDDDCDDYDDYDD